MMDDSMNRCHFHLTGLSITPNSVFALSGASVPVSNIMQFFYVSLNINEML